MNTVVSGYKKLSGPAADIIRDVKIIIQFLSDVIKKVYVNIDIIHI